MYIYIHLNPTNKSQLAFDVIRCCIILFLNFIWVLLRTLQSFYCIFQPISMDTGNVFKDNTLDTPSKDQMSSEECCVCVCGGGGFCQKLMSATYQIHMAKIMTFAPLEPFYFQKLYFFSNFLFVILNLLAKKSVYMTKIVIFLCRS